MYTSTPCEGGETNIQTEYKDKTVEVMQEYADREQRMRHLEQTVNRVRDLRGEPATSQSQQQASNRTAPPTRNQLSAACGRAFHSHSQGDNIKGVEQLLQNRESSQHADRREVDELRCRLRQLYTARGDAIPEHAEKRPPPVQNQTSKL
jgi:hypothetical protein